MTKDEKKKLGEDLATGKVLCDWQINNEEHVPLVFQAINLLTPEQRVELLNKDIGMIYEYKTAAVDTHNGIPIFCTMNVISKEEAAAVKIEWVNAYNRLHS